jgi:hypothetical protein
MELATLEGMLKQRRSLLTELANLDDEFIDYLMSVRNESTS